jgi:hypothetical protein
MAIKTKNKVLIDFESRVDLGPTYAARLIGIAYPTYAAYRSGSRELPDYHRNHVQALLLLAPEVLSDLKEEHAYGSALRQS